MNRRIDPDRLFIMYKTGIPNKSNGQRMMTPQFVVKTVGCRQIKILRVLWVLEVGHWGGVECLFAIKNLDLPPIQIVCGQYRHNNLESTFA